MKIGEVVYLKSGSLPMTLVKQEGENWVTQWSMGNALTTANIPEVALTDIDPRPALEKAASDLHEKMFPKPVEAEAVVK